ncbi:hypothetical protein [Corallococcus exiguus]|uniref:hypothetical protein n=1 Tax=Corallococcus exiguus TaxID=83462 RepID=UPI00155F8C7E|nr:hypothetical protein [Corallococcus exiguus]NRD47819.1 hypothetical protein [Corallococcus exiguus]
MEGLSTYRLGYVAQSLTLGVSAGHTCRLATAELRYSARVLDLLEAGPECR